MACTKDKFVINRGMTNEFIITIKQDDSTLPMVIADDSTLAEDNVNHTIPQSYTVIPEVPFVPAIPEVVYVAPDPGQPFIASIEGKVETYTVGVTALAETNTGTTEIPVWVATNYTVFINDVAHSVDYLAATYPSVYEFLVAMKTAINTGSEAGTVVATIDANRLVLTGTTEGVSYTVNTDDAFYVTQTQAAVVGVVGQEYIAPTLEVEAVAAVPEVPYVATQYVSTYEDVVINLYDGKMDQYDAYNSILTIDPASIDGIYVDGVEVTPIGSEYDVGAAQSATVKLLDLGTSETIPSTLVFNQVTSYGFAFRDSFELKLFELKGNTEVASIGMVDDPFVGVIEVHDSSNGQIKITMYKALVDQLTVERGDRADYYYSKPIYRLAIDSSTLNNGNFVAKINQVYVG